MAIGLDCSSARRVKDAIRAACEQIIFPSTQSAPSVWDKGRLAGESLLAVEGCVSMTLNKR